MKTRNMQLIPEIMNETAPPKKYTSIVNISRFTTPLGPMFACANDEGICLLEFAERRILESELKQLSRILKAKIICGENVHLDNLQRQVSEYFEGKLSEFDLPLVTPGTDFQNHVWKKLREIPYGKTRSYKQQALVVGNANAVRAVARANSLNRIAIIIPCHRVIGEDGNMTGYGGGIWRKKWLLDFEMKNVVRRPRSKN